MIVKFQNSSGDEREIGKSSDEKVIYQIINEFLTDHNYHSYYMRSWITEDQAKIVDVGSWSEFFHIYLEDGESWGNDK